MKRFAVPLLIALLLLTLCGCGVRIDYGRSDLYSGADMDAAAVKIRRALLGMNGCRLYSLQYAGDDVCQKELESCRKLAPERDIRECIVFRSVFRSPRFGGGAWEPNAIYTWSWTLGREPGGDWILLNYGYA